MRLQSLIPHVWHVSHFSRTWSAIWISTTCDPAAGNKAQFPRSTSGQTHGELYQGLHPSKNKRYTPQPALLSQLISVDQRRSLFERTVQFIRIKCQGLPNESATRPMAWLLIETDAQPFPITSTRLPCEEQEKLYAILGDVNLVCSQVYD